MRNVVRQPNCKYGICENTDLLATRSWAPPVRAAAFRGENPPAVNTSQSALQCTLPHLRITFNPIFLKTYIISRNLQELGCFQGTNMEHETFISFTVVTFNVFKCVKKKNNDIFRVVCDYVQQSRGQCLMWALSWSRKHTCLSSFWNHSSWCKKKNKKSAGSGSE